MADALEHALYFGEDGARRFAVLHEPARGATRRAGWLLCPALGQERGNAHRLMVEWARALARAGFTVLRFDYRGHGDSEGEEGGFGPDDHVADALAAMDELEERGAVPCVGLCGLRFGATVAALAAGSRDDRPRLLLLWEPVVSGARYVDELLRVLMAKEMAETGKAPRGRDVMRQELAAGAVLYPHGHALGEATSRAFAAVDLCRAPRPRGPVRISQISERPGRDLRRDLEKLRACYEAEGETVAEVVCAPQPWQLGKDLGWRPAELFEPALSWIDEKVAVATAAAVEVTERPEGAAARRGLGPAVLRAGGDGAAGVERVVELEVDGQRARGVLHVPAPLRADAPALVVPPMGLDTRVGYVRLTVKMARALARLGWATLRFDPRGIGDSDGETPRGPRVAQLIENQRGCVVPEMVAATDFVQRELGVRRVVALGACGGAIAAVLHADVDTRVVAVVGMELQLRFMPTPETLKVLPLESQASKLRSLRSWKRFLTFQSDYGTLARSLASEVVKRVRRRVGADDMRQICDALGPRANRHLVEALWRTLDRNVPVLLIYGATEDHQTFLDARGPLLRRRRRAELTYHFVEGADHAISLPHHQAEVVELTHRWLTAATRPRVVAAARR